MKNKIIYTILLLVSVCLNAFADSTNIKATQVTLKDSVLNPNNIPMAGLLYENGKIYTVVLVLLTIFAGIVFYLIKIEKKLKQLEQNQ